MATDLLNVSANERVDLADFEYLSDSGFQAAMREPNAQFFTDPTDQRAWILDGFEITDPSTLLQLEVTKGRAILGQREGALVTYGSLTVEGDTTKILDMGVLAANTSYGVYIRFEYVDGDAGSRVFWDPQGDGSEIAQSVPTRRNANWSIRVELTNPGAEWLRIGTADNTGATLVITDERPLYFEGEVHNAYESGWSLEGGSISADRGNDRQLHGVKDFQTFTAAMRQCIEDIKGRGLRRWWAKDIGGLNVGFDAAPVEDKIQVGTTLTYLEGTASNGRLQLDSLVFFDANLTGRPQLGLGATYLLDSAANAEKIQIATDAAFKRTAFHIFELQFDDKDYFKYTRTLDRLDWVLNDVPEVRFDTYGLNIEKGLSVGSFFKQAYDNDIRVSGGINCGGNTNPQPGDGIFTQGLNVGFDDFPIDDTINLGVPYFGLEFVSAGALYLKFDATTHLRFNRVLSLFYLTVAGVEEVHFTGTSGMNIRDGLVVGDITTVPTTGNIIATKGISVGHLGTPVVDAISVGDADFKMQWVDSDQGRLQFNDTAGVLSYLGFTRGTSNYNFIIDDVAMFHVKNTGTIRIIGGADPTTAMATPGDLYYDTDGGQFWVRGLTNTGTADINQVKSVSTVIHRNTAPFTTTGAPTDLYVSIFNAAISASTTSSKVYRVLLAGSAYRDGPTSVELQVVLGSAEILTTIPWFLDTSETFPVNDDAWSVELYLFMPPGNLASSTVAFWANVGWAEASSADYSQFQHWSADFPGVDLSNELNIIIRFKNNGNLPPPGDLKTFRVQTSLLEELAGEAS